MTLFPSRTARNIWAEAWCHTCFEPKEAAKRLTGTGPGCPIMCDAMAFQRKPRAWDRNARAATMDARYTCNAYRSQPESVRRGTAPADTPPMFEVPEHDRAFVPIEGWPDESAFKPATKAKGDHA